MGEVHVTGLDHLVLAVTDVEASMAFYQQRLGLKPVRLDEWRQGEVPFPSVRVSDEVIIDLVARSRHGDGRGEAGGSGGSGEEPAEVISNLDHFCLVIEPVDLAALASSADLDVVAGPGRRYGARGDGFSLYVRDPDGNVVELRHYG